MGRRTILAITGAVLLGTGPGAAADAGQLDPVLDAYYQANSLYNKKLYPLAEDGYREFLEKHAGHPKADEARFGLALSRYAQGKYAEVLPDLAKLAGDAKHPQATTLLLMHGKSLLETGKLAEADAVFAGGAGRAGGDKSFRSRCLAGRVDALFRMKKWGDVGVQAAEFHKSGGDGPLAERVRSQAAMAAYERGDYAEAAAALDALGADGKKLGQEGMFMLAECKRQQGDTGAARKWFEEATRMDGPRVAEALFRLGFLDFEAKQYDGAIRRFEELRRKHGSAPPVKSAALLLGRCYFEKKNHGKAKQVLGEVDSAEGAYWRARCALAEDKEGEAEGLLRAAIGRFPADPLASGLQFELGKVLFRSGKFGEAEEEFGRLLAGHPGFASAGEARRLRAHCLHREKRYQDSLAECDKALQADASAEAKEELEFLRAENLFLLGRGSDAITAYRGFVSAHGGGKQGDTARLRIGQILYREEKWSEAAAMFEPLIGRKGSGEGSFDEVAFLAGECRFGEGEMKKAAGHYQRYLRARAGKHRDTATYKRALIHAGEDRPADAKRAYRELVEKFPESPHRPAALVELGQLHHAAGEIAEAKRFLDEFVRDHGGDPLRPRAEYLLGWLALAEKRKDEARRHFEAVAKDAGAIGRELAADASFQLAVLAVEAGDFAQAGVALEGLARSESDPVRLSEVAYYLGVSQARRKQWAEARDALGKVVARKDAAQREQALYELAWCEKELEHPAEARTAYAALLDDYPDGELAGAAGLELAEIESTAGDNNAAITRLQAVLKSKDRALAAQALYRLGGCHAAEGRFDEAAQAFEQMLGMGEAPTDLAAAAYQAGEARMEARQHPEALAHFERAAGGEGDANREVREQALLRAAETQNLLGRYSDAVAACDRFLGAHADSEFVRRVRFTRGWALENLGRREEAIAEYRQVLAAGLRDETGARSQFQVGECLLALGDFDGAIKEFVKVEVSFGSGEWTPRAMLEIATALERKEEGDKALEQYRTLVEKHPDTPSATVAKQRLEKQ